MPCLFFVHNHEEVQVMSLRKIKLVGCERYNYRGELYVKSKVYAVGESKATNMLRSEDEYGRPYFVPYVKPEKSQAQVVAQKAAAAAAKAAEAVIAESVPDIVDRPDGSEPVDPVVVEEVDPEAAIEVDTDDDPALDEDDGDNAEEVDDRDDGSAVEV